MQFLNDIIDRGVAFIPVLLSLTVHEWAHAWTAWRLGDDTAKVLGRVSLNPLDHIDPVGTLLLPLMGIPFGWAKPVPINPLRFRSTISMPFGILLVAAAGPISNLILATIGGVLLVELTEYGQPNMPHGFNPKTYIALFEFLVVAIRINVVLACFNLLPIPPLDGSRIVDAIMPTTLRPFWNQLTRFGPILLIALIILPSYAGFNILSWPLHWTSQLLDAVIRH